MRWIKCSEKMPPKIEDITKNSYSVKLYNRKDAIYWDGYNWFWIGTNELVSESDFKFIEWLDETTVSDEQDKWISVEGKNFPPDNPKYYYWLYSESIDNYEMGYYDFEQQCFKSNTGDKLFYVSHWMLPTSPKNYRTNTQPVSRTPNQVI